MFLTQLMLLSDLSKYTRTTWSKHGFDQVFVEMFDLLTSLRVVILSPVIYVKRATFQNVGNKLSRLSV